MENSVYSSEVGVDNSFKSFVSQTRKQLEQNIDKITEADLVIVSGFSRSGLTSVSILVGEIISKFKIQEYKKFNTTFNIDYNANLTVINDEIYTSDLCNLMFELNIKANTKLIHGTIRNCDDVSYWFNKNAASYPSTLIIDQVFQQISATYVSEIEYNLQEFIRSIIIRQKKGIVLVKRLSKAKLFDHEIIEDKQRSLKQTYRIPDSKTLFILVDRNKQTGKITLTFNNL